jgi:two-component system, NtrC family, response regulator HydG
MSDPTARILIVDDTVDTLEVLQRNLKAEGYYVQTATHAQAALNILEHSPIDLLITDLRMPDIDGLDLIRHVRAHFRDIAVIMITGYASIESAVSAVKAGAEDYLTKPFTDEELLASVRRALDRLTTQRSNQHPQTPAATQSFGLIGESSPMRHVFRAIEKAASTTATVLITGESGTGKELVARAIHYSSDRAAAPFVPVNCAGIPEGLVESELFGHVKGAFTGAVTTRAGFFISADGGSIFLDEIGELTRAMQGKLLRVLEDGHVQIVGATRPRAVDVRVIAATNKDLKALVAKKAFRDDLYYRLNVITIELPPLRERGEDVVLLVRHFLNKFARESDKPVPHLSDRAWQCLRDYHWPGNIRELENVLQRLVVMAERDDIDALDLPSLMRFSIQRGAPTNLTLAEVQANHIQNVLASVNGNKTRAAEILGIDRKTLRESIKRYSEIKGSDEDD